MMAKGFTSISLPNKLAETIRNMIQAEAVFETTIGGYVKRAVAETIRADQDRMIGYSKAMKLDSKDTSNLQPGISLEEEPIKQEAR